MRIQLQWGSNVRLYIKWCSSAASSQGILHWSPTSRYFSEVEGPCLLEMDQVETLLEERDGLMQIFKQHFTEPLKPPKDICGSWKCDCSRQD